MLSGCGRFDDAFFGPFDDNPKTFRRQLCVNFVPCLNSVTVILPLCNVCSNSIDITTEKVKDRFMKMSLNIQLLFAISSHNEKRQKLSKTISAHTITTHSTYNL